MDRQWLSNIQLTRDHLMYWDVHMSEGDEINTFNTEVHSIYPYSASGGMYCSGIDEHTDEHLMRSALLVVHNEGFIIKQEGLTDNQPPGTVVILHPHEFHALEKVKGNAKRWAAAFYDYEEELAPEELERKLKETYKRVYE